MHGGLRRAFQRPRLGGGRRGRGAPDLIHQKLRDRAAGIIGPERVFGGGQRAIGADHPVAGDDQRDLVGAIGVIGPTRMNYARIIPMVDFTAKLVSSLFD